MPDHSDPPKLDYASPDAARRRKIPILQILIILSAASVLMAYLMSPSFRFRSRPETQLRVRCAWNLRQIGQGIFRYCNDHQGQFPDLFATELANEEITSDVFVCPSSSDTRANGPTTQATISQLATPGHCSYIYLGGGLTLKTVTPQTVVAYEPLANHGGQGMNVLFGDFHVDWIAATSVGAILNAATRPQVPATMPAGN
ncbi:MAG: hypothetical protein ABR964_16325 [Tepidisphaeraceae bacterium]|jgi:prepilin-type processing-associated H-X9-DG protein